jgi:Rieske Fe-S protein
VIEIKEQGPIAQHAPSQEIVTMSETGTTRRGFLDALLGATAVAALGSVLYPVLRYMKPQPQAGAGAPVMLAGEERARLEREKFVIIRMGPSRVIVFEDPARQVRALSARCTHEGCTVKYIPQESCISCACHDGKFDLDGRVISGPPPRPLDRFDIQRGADDSVTVVTRTA